MLSVRVDAPALLLPLMLRFRVEAQAQHLELQLENRWCHQLQLTILVAHLWRRTSAAATFSEAYDVWRRSKQ